MTNQLGDVEGHSLIMTSETERGGQHWRSNLLEDDELDRALMILESE